jgi:polyferredoxin
MNQEELEKIVEELAKAELIQHRLEKIAQNLHLIVLKYIIFTLIIALSIITFYARFIKNGHPSDFADLFLLALIILLALFYQLIRKFPKVNKWFSNVILKPIKSNTD